MSLLSSRRLAAALLPGRLVWAVRDGVRGRIAAHGESGADAGEASWQPAVGALSAALEEHAGRGAGLSVVLSGRFARCLLLPWPAQLEDEEEGAVYAAHQFRQVFGDAADGWEVRFDAEARGAQRLACGIERELLAAVRDAAKSRGARLVSVQPLLVSVFNQCRRLVGSQPTLLFLAEPGRYCGATLAGGEWRALRHGRLAGNTAEELRDALTREAALSGEAARVLLYAPEYGDIGADGTQEVRRIGPAGAAARAYVNGTVH